MTQPVLHIDFIGVNPEVTPDQREALLAAAATLRELEGVTAVGALEAGPGSDFDIAVWFVLRDFSSLEPFGTDPRYSRFLQGTVAPLIRSFAGADVTLSAESETIEGAAACLALAGPEETYDFEVREALEDWARSHEAQASIVGVAVGEKQMFRGVAVAFGEGLRDAAAPEVGPFRATLLRGITRKLA